MKRNRTKSVAICHWCKEPLGDPPHNKTLPEFTEWPSLASGVGVIVCGEKCSKRPEGAPVGARIAFTKGEKV